MMRVVFIGASEIAVQTAELLISRGHEVVIIESEHDRVEELSDRLDCGFLEGDGSKPSVLREVGPEQTDILFCLAGGDQANLIAGLVGRSLGFKRVITSVYDTDFEGICRELGLANVINPTRTISRYLADMAEGQDVLELSTVIKGEARFFSFTCDGESSGSVSDLGLPDKAVVICYYRGGEFRLAESNTQLKKDDEVVILTHSRNLEELRERWQPGEADSDGSPD